MENGLGLFLGGAAMSVLAFVVVISVAPMIGGTFENTMPDLSASSEWNTSYNTDIPTGAQVWEETIPFLIVCAIVIIASLIIYTVRLVA
jgi:hypothetical protein